MYTAQIIIPGSGHDTSADSVKAAKAYVVATKAQKEDVVINIFNGEDTINKQKARAEKRGRAFDYEEAVATFVSRNIVFATYEEAEAAAKEAVEAIFA